MRFEEVVEKFKKHPKYLTNGAGYLSSKWDVSKELIKAAKIEARSNKPVKSNIVNSETIEKPKGKLKSKWQNAAGKWLESYKFDEEDVENIDLENVIQQALQGLTPYEIPKVELSSDLVLSIYLSDQHVGASVEYGVYNNYYSGEVYNNRMYKIFKEVCKKSDLLGGFKEVNVLFLGDTFDGQDGFTVKRTHDLPQNMSNEEAFESALSINLSFLESLFTSGCAKQYNVYFVRESNHGGSMDYYLFTTLRTFINMKYPEITTKIGRAFIDHFVTNGHTFIYTHGKDNKDMKHGLPLNLNDKTEIFINQYIDYMKLSGPIHLIKGDLHQNNLNTAKKFTYRNVPSIFGSSKWIMSNYGLTDPGCGFDIFDSNSSDVLSGVITL